MIKNKDFHYLRVATCIPKVYPGDVSRNYDIIRDWALHEYAKPKEDRADVLVFPELSLTGYSCGDLFTTDSLISETLDGIEYLYFRFSDLNLTVIIGAPIPVGGKLLNCALVFTPGSREIIAIPKTYLPNYNEFYEKRWFDTLPEGDTNEYYINLPGKDLRITIKNSPVFDIKGVPVGVEICEDLWAPNPPSEKMCREGALVIFNLSASPNLIGKDDYLKTLIKSTSGRLACGYVYVSAGPNESTSDLVFSGNSYIYENSEELANNFIDIIHKKDYTITDIDIQALKSYRRVNKTWGTGSILGDQEEFFYNCSGTPEDASPLRKVNPWPLSQKSFPEIAQVLDIQANGLLKRLEVTGANPVIGVSGGTDSTLALIVCYLAILRAGRNPKDIHGITMPCFGTTKKTKSNAEKLMDALGITKKEINISETVRSHMKDIKHSEGDTNITYENCQARIRTTTLFNYANDHNGLVIGTGDLTELALGWCTYNADHMSAYNVNVSVPKTLVQRILSVLSDSSYEEDILQVFPEFSKLGEQERQELFGTIGSIVRTPISPELLPPDKDGKIAQISEDTVGPYELHDFFMYHFLHSRCTPTKILGLAMRCQHFVDHYGETEITKWLEVFFKRFRTQQFKRNCLPDGPKIGSISLSPRGDWRMPADLTLKTV